MNENPLRKGRAAQAKRAVNVSVRADLVDEAKALGTNISAVLEKALEQEHRRQRAERWREDNRGAIASWNNWIDEHGIPLAESRPW